MKLAIIMYHYVRKIRDSHYKNIKGLEVDRFKRQLDYLSRNFRILTAEELISHVHGRTAIKENSCLLTFDDGYKDHIRYVMPELLARGIQGSFFPPAMPVIEREMLDVNRVHFILASCNDDRDLVKNVNLISQEYGIPTSLLDEYWKLYAIQNRYDTKETIYIKRMLQHALPEDIRNAVASKLFVKYVGLPEKEFSDDLYLSIGDVKELVNCGMYVGSHGYRHLWLNKESRESQFSEIDLSLRFLMSVGAPTVDWIMCYPYGAYNSDTLDILGETKCAMGLTTNVDFAHAYLARSLELPRFDTNDFPQ